MLTVNVTVAWPLLSVFEVALENEPPFVLDHVIVRPAVATALLVASASCAVIVTVPPSVAVLALEVTMYFDAAPAVIVSVAGLPLTFVPPIFATMFAVPVVEGAVNVAVQTPFVQLMVPIEPTSVESAMAAEVAFVTTLPFASFTVTVIVAVPFGATDVGEIETAEEAADAEPIVVVMFELVPESAPSVAVTL